VSSIVPIEPCCFVPDNATLLQVWECLVEKGARRAVVVDRDYGSVTSMITQSRLIGYIGLINASFPEHAMSVEELKLGRSPVVCVSEDQMAFTAFTLMKEKNVSGVAVVDNEGKLIGNISSTDLKLVGFDMSYFEFLGRSVKEYLHWINQISTQSGPRSEPLVEKQEYSTGVIPMQEIRYTL